MKVLTLRTFGHGLPTELDLVVCPFEGLGE